MYGLNFHLSMMLHSLCKNLSQWQDWKKTKFSLMCLTKCHTLAHYSNHIDYVLKLQETIQLSYLLTILSNAGQYQMRPNTTIFY